jgi:hypothetical protein
MDEACSMHVRDEKCVQNFGLRNMKGRNYLGNLGKLLINKKRRPYWNRTAPEKISLQSFYTIKPLGKQTIYREKLPRFMLQLIYP